MIFYSLQSCKRTQKKCGRMANKQIYHWQTEWHSIYSKSAKSIKKLWQKSSDRKQTKLQFLEWLNDNVPFTKSKSLTKTEKKCTEKLWMTLKERLTLNICIISVPLKKKSFYVFCFTFIVVLLLLFFNKLYLQYNVKHYTYIIWPDQSCESCCLPIHMYV